MPQFLGPGFPESHDKKDVQGPGSIKVPDLGLSKPWISDLFGTLAQVCSREHGKADYSENFDLKSSGMTFILQLRYWYITSHAQCNCICFTGIITLL